MDAAFLQWDGRVRQAPSPRLRPLLWDTGRRVETSTGPFVSEIGIAAV